MKFYVTALITLAGIVTELTGLAGSDRIGGSHLLRRRTVVLKVPVERI